MKQLNLGYQAPIEKQGGAIPYDPPVHKDAKPRLSRQCKMIVNRLKAGSAYNGELAKISRKYTSRISDIRKEGIPIKATCIDRKTGLWEYGLEGWDEDIHN